MSIFNYTFSILLFNCYVCYFPIQTTVMAPKTISEGNMVCELKQARKKILKKFAEKTPKRSRNTMKAEITQRGVLHQGGQIPDWLKEDDNPYQQVARFLRLLVINSTTWRCCGAVTFLGHTTEVLENKTKRILWLQMPKAAPMPWMIKQVEKMNWLCGVVVHYNFCFIKLVLCVRLSYMWVTWTLDYVCVGNSCFWLWLNKFTSIWFLCCGYNVL